MLPGLRLRQARERLGLTYRDVERTSYELAARRGRPDFILHISRLADIENRGVVPSLHKSYTLAAIYHLNPHDIFRWYDIPIDECFHDGATVPAPQTHLLAPPTTMRIPMRFDPAFDPRRTEFLSRMVEKWGHFEGVLTNVDSHHVYGYIGTSDRRMLPLLLACLAPPRLGAGRRLAASDRGGPDLTNPFDGKMTPIRGDWHTTECGDAAGIRELEGVVGFWERQGYDVDGHIACLPQRKAQIAGRGAAV